MKYRYAELVGERRFEIKEGEISCPPGKVLVRVEACGVCMWEVHGHYLGRVGRPPMVLGHEPAGVIVEVGEGVEGFEVGDRVAGLFTKGFATHAVSDPSLLVKIPEGMPFEHALFEPMKCVTTVAIATSPKAGDVVALVGCGFMGLLSWSVVKAPWLRTSIALDIRPERLKLARELGFERVINPREEEPVEAVSRATQGRMADIVLEATGSLKGLELASKIVKPRGKVVCISSYLEPERVDLRAWGKSPIVVNAHPTYDVDPQDTFSRAAELMRKGLFPMDRLVTHKFTLDEIGDAFETALDPPPGYVKGVVLPNA